MPAELAPPSGSEELLRARAEGVQIYACEAAEGGAPTWTLVAPDAVLETADGFFASHGAGPSWTARDGSRVLGERLAGVPSLDGDGIDWLLVKAVPDGAGTFESTRFIQRLDTRGGRAPDDGCSEDTLGDETRSPYSATYVFFESES